MVFRLFRKKDTTRRALARTRRGWGGGIRSLFEGAALSDEALWERLEDALIAADVGVDASLGLVNAVRERVRAEGAADADAVAELFKEEMALLLDPADPSIWDWYDQPELPAKPFVLLVVGVNGTGKTTSVAKLAHHYGLMGQARRRRRVRHLPRRRHRAGQGVGRAVARGRGGAPAGLRPGGGGVRRPTRPPPRAAPTCLSSTPPGGCTTRRTCWRSWARSSACCNAKTPAAPHQTLLVLDATTGHNGLEQARAFQEAPGLDAVFLTKLDGSAKGGIVVAIAQQLRLPIVFIGAGEGLDDVALFDTDEFVDALLEERQPA